MNMQDEAIKYSVVYMRDKMLAEGYTVQQAADYLTSTAGIKKLLEIASKFHQAAKG